MESTIQAEQEYNQHRRGRWFLLASLVAVAGCAQRASMVVVQPNLTGPQHELHLASNGTHWVEGEQAGRILVEFPLPGAVSGKSTYLLYIRLPQVADSKKKDRDMKPCGFFIQTRGAYAGLAGIADGTVSIRRRHKNSCKLTLDVVCDDQTHIEGEVDAKEDEHSVEVFEKQSRPADVQQLVNQCSK